MKLQLYCANAEEFDVECPIAFTSHKVRSGCTRQLARPATGAWPSDSPRYPSFRPLRARKIRGTDQHTINTRAQNTKRPVTNDARERRTVAVGNEIHRLCIEMVRVLVHHLGGNRRRRPLRVVELPAPTGHIEKVQCAVHSAAGLKSRLRAVALGSPGRQDDRWLEGN